MEQVVYNKFWYWRWAVIVFLVISILGLVGFKYIQVISEQNRIEAEKIKQDASKEQLAQCLRRADEDFQAKWDNICFEGVSNCYKSIDPFYYLGAAQVEKMQQKCAEGGRRNCPLPARLADPLREAKKKAEDVCQSLFK